MRVALIPGLGALPQTTSPPPSEESLCLHRWLSGQCSSPRNMNWSSGLGHVLTMTAEADHCSSRLLSNPVPYLIGVIFLHSSFAVILQECGDESRAGRRTQFRVLGSSNPVPW